MSNVRAQREAVMDDLDKYVLEQAKTEVEHTRSWPTKVLAFFIAVNAGVVTTLFTLSSRTAGPGPLVAPTAVKALLSVALVLLAVWAVALLVKNHLSYLRHRAVQVQFQLAQAEAIRTRYPVPDSWFLEVKAKLTVRWQGWAFYAYLVTFVAGLGLAGVWVS